MFKAKNYYLIKYAMASYTVPVHRLIYLLYPYEILLKVLIIVRHWSYGDKG